MSLAVHSLTLTIPVKTDWSLQNPKTNFKQATPAVVVILKQHIKFPLGEKQFDFSFISVLNSFLNLKAGLNICEI